MERNFYTIIEDQKIPLRCGINLYAKIWMPLNQDTPLPALLEYLPYRRRDGTALRDENRYEYFLKNGFIGVRVDIRGNGDSEGIMHDEYTEEELNDGYEVIEWIAKQQWCNGNVGMMGISWGGFNALQVAALQPPSLKAIIAVSATDDRYADDIHYKGGCLANANVAWAAQMLSLSSRPPDSEIVGDKWKDIWRERLENMPLLIENWLQHPLRDDFWKHGSVCENYDHINIPVLSVGGWADCYKNPVWRLKNNLKSTCSALLGPWEHAYPDIAKNGHKIDFLKMSCEWWNKYLCHEQSDKEHFTYMYIQDYNKPSRYYKELEGFWASVDIDNDIDMQPLYLDSHNKLSKDNNNSNHMAFINSPVNLGIGASNLSSGMRTDEEIADNQQDDDDLSCYFEIEITDDNYIIAGMPEFIFEATSTVNIANIIARLCDVAPNGNSHLIALGCLNLNHTENHEAAADLKEGVFCSYKMLLDNCGYKIRKGHRLRLSLSNNYWPLLWPSPKNGTLQLKVCTASLHIPLLRHYEHVDMTVMKHSHQASRIEKRPSNYLRENSHKDGLYSLKTIDDFGLFLDERTLIAIGAKVEENFSIEENNPLSAKIKIIWEQELIRDDDWNIKTNAVTEMTSNEEYFIISLSLETYHNNKSFFKKKWDRKVKRYYG